MMSAPISILVVDDNASMAEALVDIMNLKGLTAFSANSGREAIDILRTRPVDILLTDVKMPDMNGVELYLETRKLHTQPTTFLMTAYSADDIIQEGITQGIKTILTKPMDIDFLLSLIGAVTRSSSH